MAKENITLEQVNKAVETLLSWVGEDSSRSELQETPDRVAQSLKQLLNGYTINPDEIITDAMFYSTEYSGQVLISDIHFYSFCEHHWLPFRGTINIAYVPDGKMVGLSKIVQLAVAFYQRLQTQERLTNQIATKLDEVLQAKGVIVSITATHDCMNLRGSQIREAKTTTAQAFGVYNETDWENTFYRALHATNKPPINKNK